MDKKLVRHCHSCSEHRNPFSFVICGDCGKTMCSRCFFRHKTEEKDTQVPCTLIPADKIYVHPSPDPIETTYRVYTSFQERSRGLSAQ